MTRPTSIDASAFDDAAQALERHGFERQAGRTTAWAIKRMGNAARRHVRAEARPHRRTGRLASQVRVVHRGTGLAATTRVTTGGSVAGLIIGGTAPHDIAPVRSRAIAMTGPGRAGPLIGFAAIVHHPGTRPDPYFARGVRAAGPEMREITDQAADTMARELAYRMTRRR